MGETIYLKHDLLSAQNTIGIGVKFDRQITLNLAELKI